MRTEGDSAGVVLEGAVGIYRSIDLEAGWGDDGSLIAFGSDITSLGFRPVGDLMCSAFAHVLVRGYAHPEAGTYALLLAGMKEGMLHVIGMDFYSAFADGASLTTSTTLGVRSLPAKGIHRHGYQWNGVYDLYDRHRKHLYELGAEHGDVKPVGLSLAALAESLDSFFVRQLS